MKVNELEKELNIGRANIRFYEKEGLLQPERKENGYRDYSEKDVALLKKIIIYRKLGISISNIKLIFQNEISLSDAISESISQMEGDIDKLKVAIDLCLQIQKNDITNDSFDENYFWNEVNTREEKGDEFVHFANIDITGFDDKRKIKKCIIALSVLFVIGTVYPHFYSLFSSPKMLPEPKEYILVPLAAFGAVGILIIAIANRYKLLKGIELNRDDVSQSALRFERIGKISYKIMLAYAMLNIIFLIFHIADIGVLIIPLALYYIILRIVYFERFKKRCTKSEDKLVGMQLHYTGLSLILAIISAIISAGFSE